MSGEKNQKRGMDQPRKNEPGGRISGPVRCPEAARTVPPDDLPQHASPTHPSSILCLRKKVVKSRPESKCKQIRTVPLPIAEYGRIQYRQSHAPAGAECRSHPAVFRKLQSAYTCPIFDPERISQEYERKAQAWKNCLEFQWDYYRGRYGGKERLNSSPLIYNILIFKNKQEYHEPLMCNGNEYMSGNNDKQGVSAHAVARAGTVRFRATDGVQ